MKDFEKSTELPVNAAEAFAWHERPGAFGRLLPPWQQIAVRQAPGGIQNGSTVELDVHKGPLKVAWKLRHRDYQPGEQFVDEQVEGPFASWLHRHRFSDTKDGSKLVDHITYQLPAVASWADCLIASDLERVFRYRHATTRNDLARLREKGPFKAKRILVTGSTGLVGEALTAFLQTQGHVVIPQSRRDPGTSGLVWDPVGGEPDLTPFEPLDAVVHLAGAPIAQRWTNAAKRAIRESRLAGTRHLANALAKLEHQPVLLSASGINFYGHDPKAEVEESAPVGRGFLAEVAADWEAACAPAEDAGLRVVKMRLGTVLSPAGGAIAKLLPVFSAGGGGPIGNGRRVMPWIAIDDLLYALDFCLENESIFGPVNFVAPEQTPNKAFAEALGKALQRPAIVRTPSFVLRAAFGEMAGETILADLPARPARLLDAGFDFRFPGVEAALLHLFGRC